MGAKGGGLLSTAVTASEGKTADGSMHVKSHYKQFCSKDCQSGCNEVKVLREVGEVCTPSPLHVCWQGLWSQGGVL